MATTPPPSSEQVPAGQELDERIAREVFNQEVIHRDGFIWMGERWLPCYSTEISAAWELVEHLKRTDRRGFEDFTLVWGNFGADGVQGHGQLIVPPELAWLCTFNRNIVQHVTAETAPLAIVLAALKCVETGR